MDSILKFKGNKLINITSGDVCDLCIGRNLSGEVPEKSNQERGEYFRKNNIYSSNSKSSSDCVICLGLFANLQTICDTIIDHTNELEFSNFLVGCKLPHEIMEKEKETQNILQVNVESIKKEFNREIGKILEEKLDKEVEFKNPELVIMVDMIRNKIQLQINPLFIEGRYKKMVRNIPQTKWPCRKCKGKGCEYCGHTGKMYQESVEELISPEVLKVTMGSDSKFHGAGREDIDVRMLGTGRPFVLEIKEPKKRFLDLVELENKINNYAKNKVEVDDLKITWKGRKGEIKNSSTQTQKTYRALVKLDDEVSEEDLKKLNQLKIIKQRTPLRVSHRRADKIRERQVNNLKVHKIDPFILELEILCEGGLYIKELISGDKNRTIPSVSSLLGIDARCVELDVVNVNL
jgi:tRNA pseudouridine synthase 10